MWIEPSLKSTAWQPGLQGLLYMSSGREGRQGLQEPHAILLVIHFPVGLQSSSYCQTTNTFTLWLKPETFSVHSMWTNRQGTPALQLCGEHIFCSMMGERLENLSPGVLVYQVNSSSLLLQIIDFKLFGRAVNMWKLQCSYFSVFQLFLYFTF